MTSSPPLRVSDLLVGRGHLVVAVVEVGGQEGEDVVDPVLVVGAAVLDAAGPAAAHGAEAHRACSRRRASRSPRRRPGSSAARGRGSAAGASAAPSRCRRGSPVAAGQRVVGVEPVGAAPGDVVGDRAGAGTARARWR